VLTLFGGPRRVSTTQPKCTTSSLPAAEEWKYSGPENPCSMMLEPTDSKRRGKIQIDDLSKRRSESRNLGFCLVGAEAEIDDCRPISHRLFNQPEYPYFDAVGVSQLCASVARQEEISLSGRVGQIIARDDRRWLIRVNLRRDHEANERNYHNRTIHRSMREAQSYLTRKLRARDLGRDLVGAKITLNEYLGPWPETAYDREYAQKPSKITRHAAPVHPTHSR
jgi:hypothetical protein